MSNMPTLPAEFENAAQVHLFTTYAETCDLAARAEDVNMQADMVACYLAFATQSCDTFGYDINGLWVALIAAHESHFERGYVTEVEESVRVAVLKVAHNIIAQ